MSYPNVICERHEPAAPGYVVCVHVEQGAAVGLFEPCSSSALGQILCAECRECPEPLSEKSAAVVCARCAADRGWLFPKNLGAE